jgi:hypothetical protein
MRTLLATGLLLSTVATLAWAGIQGAGGHKARTGQAGGGTDLPPVCCFFADCQPPAQTLEVECTGDETTFVLDATGTYDPEGNPVTVFWQSCPGSTIDDPTAMLTILRIDTSSSCDIHCGVRLFVNDGVNTVQCRIFVQVTQAPGGCTLTQGYWKNHGPVGCVSGNNTNEWPVNQLDLGSLTYSDSELCSILKQSVQGNGLVSLAHQLIAAKLNAANGASLPQVAADAIDDADALIGSLVVPPVGSGFLAPETTSFLTGVLNAYNNGKLEGTVHCD